MSVQGGEQGGVALSGRLASVQLSFLSSSHRNTKPRVVLPKPIYSNGTRKDVKENAGVKSCFIPKIIINSAK